MVRRQTPLERTTYRRELAFALSLLAVLVIGSFLLLKTPTVDEISRDIFDQVVPEKRERLLYQANALLTRQPELVSSPRQWKRELERLVLNVK